MPKITGVQVTQAIRFSSNDPPRNIAMVTVTADEQYHSDATAREHGMDGYISKPIMAGELLGLVEQYCTAA